jgi:hypothetical protein
MAAADNLNKRLFHGTGHFFAEGEIIEPRSTTSGMEGNVAFATTEPIDAAHYAGLAARSRGAMFAPVYEVEPLEGGHTQRHPHGLTIQVSRTGYKPKGVVGWGYSPESVA